MAVALKMNNIAALIRNEFKRRQFLVAVFSLICLNNAKKARDFTFANKKIDEQKSFNNLLFAFTIIQEIVKELNLQKLISFAREQNSEAFRLAENQRLLEQIQKTLLNNALLYQQVENEKNQLIKNQLLLKNVGNADEKVLKMIDASENRIVRLNSAIEANITENKNIFSNILNNTGYNKKPIDLNIGNTQIHFEPNEIVNNLNAKMAEKFEEGSLTKENLLDETKIAYREVIEDKAKESGLDIAESQDEIDRAVNENFPALESAMKADDQTEKMYEGLDKHANLLEEKQSEILRKSALEEVHENLQSEINSDEPNFQTTQQVLQSSLEKIALLEFARNPNFVLEQDEELLFDDEPLNARANNILEARAPLSDNQAAVDAALLKVNPPGGPSVDYEPENVEEAGIKNEAANQNENRHNDNDFKSPVDSPSHNQLSNEQQAKNAFIANDSSKVNKETPTPPQEKKEMPASNAKQPNIPNNIVKTEKTQVGENTPPIKSAEAEVKNSNAPLASLKEIKFVSSSKGIFGRLDISADNIEKNLADGKNPSPEAIKNKQSQAQKNVNNPSVKNQPDEPEPDKPEDKTPKRRR
jgi:hypothetical protein